MLLLTDTLSRPTVRPARGVSHEAHATLPKCHRPTSNAALHEAVPLSQTKPKRYNVSQFQSSCPVRFWVSIWLSKKVAAGTRRRPARRCTPPLSELVAC